jgi:DNA transposition AAA+ family ATPase
MKKAFITTSNVRMFSTAMLGLQNRQDRVPGFGLVYSEPGLGKTESAIWFTASHPDAVYIRAKAVMSPRWLLEELAGELGEQPAWRTADLFRQCCANLTETRRIVLVDEVDFLVRDPRMIETLRDLHDSTHTPIVLMGMNGVEKKLARYKHIYDRFAEIVHFHELDRSDMKLISEQLCDVKLTPDAVDYLYSQAKRFRQAVRMLYKAEHIARNNSLKEINAAQLAGSAS